MLILTTFPKGINFYLLRTFFLMLVVFVLFLLSLCLVSVSPVFTAFHSCCLSHQVFDQVNLWPAWIGFETAIFWQCSPGTADTNSQLYEHTQKYANIIYTNTHINNHMYDHTQQYENIIYTHTHTHHHTHTHPHTQPPPHTHTHREKELYIILM